MTLPAFPILNQVRLQAAMNRQADAGPYPYGLVSAICGHALVYYPTVRATHFRQVWTKILQAEEEEYRQPKLQTLQLTLIDLATRPAEGHAANCISLSRVSTKTPAVLSSGCRLVKLAGVASGLFRLAPSSLGDCRAETGMVGTLRPRQMVSNPTSCVD